MAASNKRRNRLVLVCNNCHKKKIKCDRNLPCSSCVKLSIDSTCFYSAPTYKKEIITERTTQITENINNELGSISNQNLVTTNSILLEQVESLKEKIKQLEESINNTNSKNNISNITYSSNKKSYNIHDLKKLSADQILENIVNSNANNNNIGINPHCSPKYTYNFYNSLNSKPDNEDSIMVHPPQPLWMITLSRSDPCSKLMLNYLHSREEKSGSTFFSIYSKNKMLTKETVETLDRKSMKYYGNKYIKRLSKFHNELEINTTKRSISLFGFEVGLAFSEINLSNLTLVQQIKSVLPPIKAINLLIHYFFKFLYNSFPFLEKEVFISKIESILSTKLDNEYEYSLVSNVCIKNNEDLANIIVLLPLLRMSYLSVLGTNSTICMNDIDIDINERDYLLKYPIVLDCNMIAERCLKILDFDCLPKIFTLQAFLFIYIYRYIAPEEGFLNEDFEFSLTFNKIIQQANFLLLNRDPKHTIYWNNQKDDNKYFKRKFWFMLLLMDIENSIVMGCAPCTSRMNYDNKFSGLEDDNSLNSFDINERKLIKAIKEIQDIVIKGHCIVEQIFLLCNNIELTNLLQAISDFELIIKKTLGDMNDYLNFYGSKFDILKLMKFRVYLYFKFLLMYLYYSFFLYFEKKDEQELSFFFLKKIYSTAFFELAGITTGFLENCDKFFGPSSSMILKPITLIINRFQMLCCVLRVRIKCTLIVNDKCRAISELSNSIIKKLVFMEEEGARFVYKVSKQNKYAWWYCKGYRFGQNMILNPQFYTLNEKDTINACLNYSIDDLNCLSELLDLFKHKLISLKEYYSKLLSEDEIKLSVNTINDHENELMEQVQIDKMWQSLQSLKEDSKERYFRKYIHNNQNEEYLFNDNIISSETSSTDELWKIDFDVLKNFLTDDLFFAN